MVQVKIAAEHLSFLAVVRAVFALAVQLDSGAPVHGMVGLISSCVEPLEIFESAFILGIVNRPCLCSTHVAFDYFPTLEYAVMARATKNQRLLFHLNPGLALVVHPDT
jgi:hypothetical protein